MSIPIFSDVEYRLLAHQAQATVTKVEPARNGTLVEYEFTDANGTRQTGKDTAPVGWTAPPAATITVQYLPGQEADARLSRGSLPWQVYALFVGSGLGLVMIIVLAVRRS